LVILCRVILHKANKDEKSYLNASISFYNGNHQVVIHIIEKVEAVQRMKNYIVVHLTERVILADLSEAGNITPWNSASYSKN